MIDRRGLLKKIPAAAGLAFASFTPSAEATGPYEPVRKPRPKMKPSKKVKTAAFKFSLKGRATPIGIIRTLIVNGEVNLPKITDIKKAQKLAEKIAYNNTIYVTPDGKTHKLKPNSDSQKDFGPKTVFKVRYRWASKK